MKTVKVTIISALLFLALGISAARAQVTVGVSISARIAPPPLIEYEQPPCPADGYLWIPGYWAWDEYEGYYWVPGYWVQPPMLGYLWTPCYWEFAGGVYVFHPGYWGPHVGFYGGVHYGYGYDGYGFTGGMWRGPVFRYNTAVVRVNTTVVHNTYIDRTVIHNTTVNRVSYNGGPGGLAVRPRADQQIAVRQRLQATTAQVNYQRQASANRNQFANVNHGRPANTVSHAPLGPRPAAQPNANMSRPVSPHPNPNVNEHTNIPPGHSNPAPLSHTSRPSAPAHAQPVNRPAPPPHVNQPAPRPAQPAHMNQPMPHPQHMQQPHPQPMPQQHAPAPHEEPHRR